MDANEPTAAPEVREKCNHGNEFAGCVKCANAHGYDRAVREIAAWLRKAGPDSWGVQYANSIERGEHRPKGAA